MAKFIAIGKGQNLQKTNPDAHAQLVKWNKFQLGFKNSIKSSLPSNGNNPAETLQAIFEWDASAGITMLPRICSSFFIQNHPLLSPSGATSQLPATEGCTARGLDDHLQAHPVEELCWPPCISDGKYTEEEQQLCMQPSITSSPPWMSQAAVSSTESQKVQ
jgi:hypothetical protein